MPVITRFQLKNANAMRDRRARVRAIARDSTASPHPICTLEISEYSETSDDETETVCSDKTSEYLLESENETDSEYVPESESEEEESPEDTLARLKEKIAELEKRIEADKEPEDEPEPEPESTLTSWDFAVKLMLFVSLMSYFVFIIDQVKHHHAPTNWF